MTQPQRTSPAAPRLTVKEDWCERYDAVCEA
jgi:hypothetical protein